MALRKRAVNDAQKTERCLALLATAEQLFQGSSYAAITMDAVASQAGVAKGTLYLYFKTKEALFLALYVQTLEQWFDTLADRLQTVVANQQGFDVASFVALVGESLPTHPTLARLMVISHSILEHNIDAVTALNFKRMLRSRVEQIGQLTEVCLPFLKPGQGAQLFLQMYVLVIGFQNLAEPGPVVKQVLANPELALFRLQFADQFLTTLLSLLEGIAYQNRRTTNHEPS